MATLRAGLRAAVAAATALGLLLTSAACEPRTDNSERRIHCAVTGDPPDRDSDDAPRRVTAKVRFWCDKPGAEALTLTLRLQKRDARGVWRDAARSTFTVRRAQTVRTDSERYRTRQVSVACSRGVFRTVVSGRSTARGRTTTYDQTGSTSTDPCVTSLN